MRLRASFSKRQIRYGLLAVLACILLLSASYFLPTVVGHVVSYPQISTLKIAAAFSLEGSGASYGRLQLEGAQLAVEEANATDSQSKIELIPYNDFSDPDRARKVATEIINSNALVVVGPTTTLMALAAGPLYAQANLVSLTTATGDGVTKHRTTFRSGFSTSDGGTAIAEYLYYVLGGKRAAVFFKDDGYGQPFVEGFKRVAEPLKMVTDYYSFKTLEEGQEIAKRVATDPNRPSIVLGMLVQDAVSIVTTIKRQNPEVPILSTNTIADEFFTDFFREQPEEHSIQGYFTNGVYAAAPVFFDSANAETLAFADRFRTRFGHEPSYIEVQGYEATRFAISAVQAAVQTQTVSPWDLPRLREAVRTHLMSIDSLQVAMQGLNGPLWFTPQRGCKQTLRVGRFQNRILESAPIQLTPVLTPDSAEIALGTVFRVGRSDRYARLQKIVYTGVFINQIPLLDLSKSEFTADFYLWLRFAGRVDPKNANPLDIRFPQLIEGNFDPNQPAEKQTLPDGMEYRLWQVQGKFRNDFNLHRFPFDRQRLSLSFFNARAPMEKIVYVLDKRSNADPFYYSSTHRSNTPLRTQATESLPSNDLASAASTQAFRDLTQWRPIAVRSRRENLVTNSALGNPRQMGVASQRELSGFVVSIELQRRTLATLTKTLLPLILLTFILYASLYFPIDWESQKVTVATTAALSGAVLLTSINNQLGNIGYTIAVEYAFYVFFCLCLLCIVSVLSAEHLRSQGNTQKATRLLHGTRLLFVLAIVATLGSALVLYWQR